MAKPKIFDGYLTTTGAARILGVSREYVRRLRKLGALLPREYVGRIGLYHEDDVRAYAAGHPRLGLRRTT